MKLPLISLTKYIVQNISDPSTQKQLRIQINNVPQSANEDLIESQPEKTNSGSSSSSSSSDSKLL